MENLTLKDNDLDLRGYVEIFSIDNNSNKKLVSKSNLIVYRGREWVLSRLVNYDNTNILPLSSNYISWLSVGTGGAPASSPLSPIPPTNTDIALNNEVPIIANAPNLADNGNKIGFSDITFLQDNLNLNKYLILRLDILLDQTMCNGYNINEAGLWVSNSNDPTIANQFYLFSHITFPTIAKGTDISVQFIWYIYS